MRILTVIQARTGSSRLPGKALLPLGDSTVLGQMLRRVRAARQAGVVVVATTTEAADDAVVTECVRHEVACFRGHATDLLDRHYRAALAYPCDAVVKIPSDCPLIDPTVIDRVISHFEAHNGGLDYVSNLHPQSYPDGNDVEVMAWGALEIAHREAQKEYEREHTTPFLWNHPERFRLGNVLWEQGKDRSQDLRWTLDYREDYELIRAIFEALYPGDPLFGVKAIADYVDSHPDVRRLNAMYLGDAWYHRQKHDLKVRPC